MRCLTAVEVDEQAALVLMNRYAGTNVDVVVADAAGLGFPDCSFDSVGCFTMLHHVPTTESQCLILAAAFRVLRPGGVFVGSDSLAGDDFRAFHDGDTYNPIAPVPLTQLLALGFTSITVAVDYDLRFTARKPGGDDTDSNGGGGTEVTPC